MQGLGGEKQLMSPNDYYGCQLVDLTDYAYGGECRLILALLFGGRFGASIFIGTCY